jgi:hypothetical protein
VLNWRLGTTIVKQFAPQLDQQTLQPLVPAKTATECASNIKCVIDFGMGKCRQIEIQNITFFSVQRNFNFAAKLMQRR